jgi:hypothetical protein
MGSTRIRKRLFQRRKFGQHGGRPPFEEASLPAIVCGWYQRWPSARDRASLARLWSTQDLADASQDALRLGASSSRF